MLRNSDTSYGKIAKLFHWSVALLILGLLSVGFYMASMTFSPAKLQIYGLHKSFGILVLMLAGLRLLWKGINPRPEELPSHAQWERVLAKIAHILLYLAMFVMPLSGWLMSSAGGFPAGFFGLFELPPLSGKDESLFRLAKGVHEISAIFLIGLIGLHMAGAFKHHFIDRDETLQRMTCRSVGFWRGAVLAAIAGALLAGPVYFFAMSFVGQNNQEKLVVEAEADSAEAVPAEMPGEMVVEMSDQWIIDKDNSFIEFEAMQNGQPFTGRFDFDGKITFDPENLEQANADILIDIASIRTGSQDRDEQAKGEAWFDTAQFPKAKFVTKFFQHLGANQYVARSVLYIKFARKPFEFPFTLDISDLPEGGQKAIMIGETTLDRQDFRVGTGQWESGETIGNKVKINVRVEAVREAAGAQ